MRGTQEALPRWRRVLHTVDSLIGQAIGQRYVERHLPELADLPPNFQLVLREIDRYFSSYPPGATNTALRTTPEVEEA